MANRGTWNIEKKSGVSYVSDGTIYRPNENLSVDLTSTQTKIQLADGSNAFVIPEIAYNKDPLRFVWLSIEQSDTFRTKIENYIINSDYLRITTHLSETLIGKFTYIRRVWLTGEADVYDLEAGFERME